MEYFIKQDGERGNALSVSVSNKAKKQSKHHVAIKEQLRLNNREGPPPNYLLYHLLKAKHSSGPPCVTQSCVTVTCPLLVLPHDTPRKQDQSICLLSSVFAVSGTKLVEKEVERNV